MYTEIRSDLWNDMDVSELNNQKDLILEKLSLLSTITATQSIINMSQALQLGMQDIDKIIDFKLEQPIIIQKYQDTEINNNNNINNDINVF